MKRAKMNFGGRKSHRISPVADWATRARTMGGWKPFP